MGTAQRDQEIDYAAAHNIPIPVSHDHDYSMDRNMWHLSHEGSDLEDPWNAPKDELFIVTNIPEKAPDKPEYVELEYVEGVPVSVNGEKLSPAKLVEKLNEIGIRNAVGITDMVEDRLVGMKSRGVYENPAGAIIYYGHNDLENLCLDRATQSFKQQVSIRYSELVYDGMWFSPLREALDAFVTNSKTVTGTVRMKLYKGNIYSAGVKSPVLPVQPGICNLRRRRSLQPGRCYRLHQPLRPAAESKSADEERKPEIMAKLWGGRFSKNTNELVDAFNASIDFDKRLYHEDIRGSIAHAGMLAKCGIIPAEDGEKIIAGLKDILADIEAGNFHFDVALEDIHMNVEARLTERIGSAGAVCIPHVAVTTRLRSICICI